MNCINRVFLVGRLGSKPEIKKSRNGKSYTQFNIATNHSRKKEDGTYEELTEWHRIMVWGYQAERCVDRCDKGSPIFIEGELNHYKKVEEDGKTRWGTSVTAQNVSFLGLPLQSATAS